MHVDTNNYTHLRTLRLQTDSCYRNFTNDFETCDFSEITNTSPVCDPNITYNNLDDIITVKTNMHFPITEKKSKGIKLREHLGSLMES